MTSAVYQVQDVSKIYKKGKKVANEHITFDVVAGEILGLLGPNGAGKSTLVKQMVGQLRPSTGSISLYGMDVTKHSKAVARLVGYYSQEPHAMSSLTVREALLFTGRLRGMSLADAERETTYWIDRLDLSEVEKKQLKRISGGQKRLVGLGTTIVGSQPVLIFDEPTNELDPRKRKLVWDIIRERNRDHGATVLLVTHNVLEAEQVVDRVAVIEHGHLLAMDTVGQLKKLVDQRLKIELSIQLGRRAQAEGLLKAWGLYEVVGENRLRVLVTREESADYLQRISTHLDELACEEYRVIPPTLEDVYFHFGGKDVAMHG